MYIDLFEQFVQKMKDAATENFEPPKYVVQPQKGDTGFFLVKKEFEKMKRRYHPSISYSFADTDNEDLKDK